MIEEKIINIIAIIEVTDEQVKDYDLKDKILFQSVAYDMIKRELSDDLRNVRKSE